VDGCIKAAFHDTDTDILAKIVARISACRATSPFSLQQEQLEEIARVGRKDVVVSDDSVSVSVSWNVVYCPETVTHPTTNRSDIVDATAQQRHYCTKPPYLPVFQ